MKVNGLLKVLPAAESVGHFLDGLDLGIEPHANRGGDAVNEDGQHVGEVAADQARGLDQGRRALLYEQCLPRSRRSSGPLVRPIFPEHGLGSLGIAGERWLCGFLELRFRQSRWSRASP